MRASTHITQFPINFPFKFTHVDETVPLIHAEILITCFPYNIVRISFCFRNFFKNEWRQISNHIASAAAVFSHSKWMRAIGIFIV